jgi:chemotaxis protein methyltransferase CheR
MSLVGQIRQGTRALRQEQAAMICRIARERGGLSIAPHKTSFLEQRLLRRMRVTGHADFDQYLGDLMRSGPGVEAEVEALIEVLTTHTTSFFRERAQFDWLLGTALPELVHAGAGRERPILVWSAACSNGAEMWSAAMLLDRLARGGTRGLRWQVVGSDLSRQILDRAGRAIYSEDEIEGLPEDLRRAYLLRSRGRHGGRHLFRISPDLRRRARLYQANLVEGPPPLETAADVAFLRNVLIYFDEKGRAAALRNVLSRLRPGGYLLTGHTESLNPVPDGLTQVAASTYRKL